MRDDDKQLLDLCQKIVSHIKDDDRKWLHSLRGACVIVMGRLRSRDNVEELYGPKVASKLYGRDDSQKAEPEPAVA